MEQSAIIEHVRYTSIPTQGTSSTSHNHHAVCMKHALHCHLRNSQFRLLLDSTRASCRGVLEVLNGEAIIVMSERRLKCTYLPYNKADIHKYSDVSKGDCLSRNRCFSDVL